MKRIESFRRIIRDQTEETNRKLLRNQESLKNILNPKVTEHKFTMNTPFRSQSPAPHQVLSLIEEKPRKQNKPKKSRNISSLFITGMKDQPAPVTEPERKPFSIKHLNESRTDPAPQPTNNFSARLLAKTKTKGQLLEKSLRLKKRFEEQAIANGIKKGRLRPLSRGLQMNQYITIDSMKKARPLLDNASTSSANSAFNSHTLDIGSKLDLQDRATTVQDESVMTFQPNMTQFTLDHLSGKDILKKLPAREQTALAALINDHLLQNAIAQRQTWKEKYGVSDRELFELFSEFTAMMVITR